MSSVQIHRVKDMNVACLFASQSDACPLTCSVPLLWINPPEMTLLHVTSRCYPYKFIGQEIFTSVA